jgi:YD repeat-containing protein
MRNGCMSRIIIQRASLLTIAMLAALALTFPSGALAFDAPWDSGHNTTNFPGGRPPYPPGGGNQEGGGDPVNIEIGNFTYSEEDFFIPGLGFTLKVVRYYNSQDRYNGPMGFGWHFVPFMKLIEVVKGAEKNMVLKRGDGIRVQFKDNGDGTYETPSTGWFYQLTQTQGGFTLKEKGGIVHNFDAAGRLISTVDRNGNQMSYGYDTGGHITSITDASQRQIAFAYGANDKISTATDFTGRVFKYEYDSNDNLIRVTNPLDFVTSYAYDSEHRLLSITDHQGVTIILNTYNDRNGVVTQTYNNGTINFTYNTDFTRINNRRGFNSDVYYNSQGNPTRIIDPSGNTTNFSYGDNLSLVRVSDWSGDTDFTYDGNSNITSVKAPTGATTTYVYDQTTNQITSITDPLNNTTLFEYDGNGNLIKMTDPLGQDTLYEYDAQGKLTKITAPGNRVTTFTRSSVGYLTGITDTVGSDTYTLTLAYDSLGNVTTVTTPGGGTIVNEYDALGRITKVTDNTLSPARVFQYEYDGNGRITKITENGSVKAFEYTGNRVTKITYPDSTSVSYTYSANDLFTGVTYALGNIGFTYDNTDRVTKVTNPDASEINFTYTNDYLTRITGPGIDVSFVYDADRRLLKAQDALTTKEISFTYDAAGNRTQMVDSASGTTTYSYDAVNRLTSILAPDGQTTNYPTPVAVKRTTILNDIISAYNNNENNRLVSLVTEKGSGDIIANYSFEYPDVRYRTKSFQANKRWYSWVQEDVRDKRGVRFLRSPFDLIK